MASVTVRKRVLSTGDARYDVRYRRGGRGYRTEHAGTFTARKHADRRRDLVEGWLAAGLDPREELEKLTAPAPVARMADVTAGWLRSRRSLAPNTRDDYERKARAIAERFPDALAVTAADVNDWLDELAQKRQPGTVATYLRALRMILDHAERDANPARHRSVETPRVPRRVVEPPDADAVLFLLRRLQPPWRRPTMLLEQTGLRVGELVALSHADVDRDGCRLRVRPEVSKTGRGRWVELADWHLELVADVFTGMDRRSLRNTMARACLGGEHIHPHLLRHRRATLWHQAGVTAVELAARLGHSQPSISLDVYSHVRRLHEIPVEKLIRLV